MEHLTLLRSDPSGRPSFASCKANPDQGGWIEHRAEVRPLAQEFKVFQIIESLK